uniref:SCP domain-containing protein n=1 Tax=Globodera pallida TaxID=36090 RepID=A0A183BXQ1_GLOPA
MLNQSLEAFQKRNEKARIWGGGQKLTAAAAMLCFQWLAKNGDSFCLWVQVNLAGNELSKQYAHSFWLSERQAVAECGRPRLLQRFPLVAFSLQPSSFCS